MQYFYFTGKDSSVAVVDVEAEVKDADWGTFYPSHGIW